VPLVLSVLSRTTPEKNLALSSLRFSIRYLHTCVRLPWSLLFSRLNSPSSLSPSCLSDAPSCNHLCGLSLGLLQYIHVSCTEESRSGAPSGWVKRKYHLCQPAGITLPLTAQEAVSLCHKHTLVVHAKLASTRTPSGLFCKAAFQSFSAQPVLVWGVFPP